MKTIRDEVFPSDVDGTLTVRPEDPGYDETKRTVPVWHDALGTWVTIQPNFNQVLLLKEKKQQGYMVIVWSQGGGGWAEAVVNALGIRSDVDLCMKKPKCYADDLTCEKWMGEKIFIPANVRYKL